MSASPQPERVAEGIVPVAWTKLLPYLALFVRLAIGLALLNTGLAAVLTGGQGPRFGGPGGWAGNPSPPILPGLDLFVLILPYLVLAIGIGLVFGIFTTLSALLACGLALVFPILHTLHLVVAGGIAGNPNVGPFGLGFRGPEAGLAFIIMAVAGVPGLVTLVLLSPPSINKFSIDVLIFGRTASPRPPVPEFRTPGAVEADRLAPEGPGTDQFASV